MTYFITPHPYHYAHHWRRMMEYRHPEHRGDFTLAVDITEKDDAYILKALVPGLKAEDLNIQILDDVVSLEGEFKVDESEYLVHELPHGSFLRSLRLPAALDSEKAEAKVSDGVLTLSLPKAESARPKSIKVVVK